MRRMRISPAPACPLSGHLHGTLNGWPGGGGGWHRMKLAVSPISKQPLTSQTAVPPTVSPLISSVGCRRRRDEEYGLPRDEGAVIAVHAVEELGQSDPPKIYAGSYSRGRVACRVRSSVSTGHTARLFAEARRINLDSDSITIHMYVSIHAFGLKDLTGDGIWLRESQ